MARTFFSGPVVHKGGQKITVQAAAELDLTSTNNSANVLLDTDGLRDVDGGDVAVPIAIHGLVTEAVAADSTAPVVQVQDESNNATGASITLTDGDAIDDYVTSAVSDGTAMTPVDLTSENMILKVSTAAADSGTAAGKVKFFVDVLLVK